MKSSRSTPWTSSSTCVAVLAAIQRRDQATGSVRIGLVREVISDGEEVAAEIEHAHVEAADRRGRLVARGILKTRRRQRVPGRRHLENLAAAAGEQQRAIVGGEIDRIVHRLPADDRRQPELLGAARLVLTAKFQPVPR